MLSSELGITLRFEASAMALASATLALALASIAVLGAAAEFHSVQSRTKVVRREVPFLPRRGCQRKKRLDLIRSPTVLDDEKGNLIGAVIRNGRPGKGMSAFTPTPGPDFGRRRFSSFRGLLGG